MISGLTEARVLTALQARPMNAKELLRACGGLPAQADELRELMRDLEKRKRVRLSKANDRYSIPCQETPPKQTPTKQGPKGRTQPQMSDEIIRLLRSSPMIRSELRRAMAVSQEEFRRFDNALTNLKAKGRIEASGDRPQVLRLLSGGCDVKEHPDSDKSDDTESDSDNETLRTKLSDQELEHVAALPEFNGTIERTEVGEDLRAELVAAMRAVREGQMDEAQVNLVLKLADIVVAIDLGVEA